MQLRKIKNDHYIVVDSYENIECSEDGYSYNHNGKLLPIVATTNQDIKAPNMINLDLDDVKSLVGEINVRAIAEEKYPYEVGYGVNDENIKMGELQDAFIKGYNQCLEDNRLKGFTLSDIQNAWGIAYINGHFKDNEHIDDISFVDFISSITTPKDTWEVEFDSDNNLKLK